MKVSEPTATYGSSNVQRLKKQIISTLEKTHDEEKLQQCIELLNSDSMPCRYTEEELDKIIKLAENDVYVSNEEVKAMFEKWKI